MKTFLFCLIALINFIVINGATTRILRNSPPTNDTNRTTTTPHQLHHRSVLSLFWIPKALEANESFEFFYETKTDDDSDSSDEYPHVLSDDVLRKGAIVLVFLIGVYCFTLLAIVCDQYFLPCVEKICIYLHLSPDVAAATFMSVATSCPELFVNIISTFIVHSDVGVGTVVGSSLFNALGVASLGSLAAPHAVQLDWWPLTRDVIIYICAVLLLIVITYDGVIYWYEGLVLFIVYFLYFILMFQNDRISRFIKKLAKRMKRKKVYVTKQNNDIITNNNNNCKDNNDKNEYDNIDDNDSVHRVSHYGSYIEGTPQVEVKIVDNKASQDEEPDEGMPLFHLPHGSVWTKFLFFYTWPIRFVLFCTVPNPRTRPKLFPITFICCIVWIGTNSYVVSWMFAIIGHIFNIPDTVLGLTFLAAGGCLPESISLTIMSRRGEGSMGVSNSLGANTMNILLSLGMPWFLKTITLGMNDDAYITLESDSIQYTIMGLILAALALYATLYFNKFQLRKRVGVILLFTYTIFAVLAILSEMVF